MIDTHSHPYLPEFDSDRDEIMLNAQRAGVRHIILPNVDVSTIQPMRELHGAYKELTSMALGLHPTEVNESWRDSLAMIEQEWNINQNDYIAVGEVGIDLYWDKTFADEQMQVFDIQVRKALDMDIPVIIHCRDGLDEVLEVLSGVDRPPKAVFHSFGGTADDVDKVRRVGDFYFGLNGVVTFKNSRLDDTIQEITLDRILLETDAPYLAPVPLRGKRNQPSYIQYTCAHIASVLEQPSAVIADKTTMNASLLFNLNLPLTNI